MNIQPTHGASSQHQSIPQSRYIQSILEGSQPASFDALKPFLVDFSKRLRKLSHHLDQYSLPIYLDQANQWVSTSMAVHSMTEMAWALCSHSQTGQVDAHRPSMSQQNNASILRTLCETYQQCEQIVSPQHQQTVKYLDDHIEQLEHILSMLHHRCTSLNYSDMIYNSSTPDAPTPSAPSISIIDPTRLYHDTLLIDPSPSAPPLEDISTHPTFEQDGSVKFSTIKDHLAESVSITQEDGHEGIECPISLDHLKQGDQMILLYDSQRTGSVENIFSGTKHYLFSVDTYNRLVEQEDFKHPITKETFDSGLIVTLDRLNQNLTPNESPIIESSPITLSMMTQTFHDCKRSLEDLKHQHEHFKHQFFPYFLQIEEITAFLFENPSIASPLIKSPLTYLPESQWNHFMDSASQLLFVHDLQKYSHQLEPHRYNLSEDAIKRYDDIKQLTLFSKSASYTIQDFLTLSSLKEIQEKWLFFQHQCEQFLQQSPQHYDLVNDLIDFSDVIRSYIYKLKQELIHLTTTLDSLYLLVSPTNIEQKFMKELEGQIEIIQQAIHNLS